MPMVIHFFLEDASSFYMWAELPVMSAHCLIFLTMAMGSTLTIIFSDLRSE